jgi:transcriptional regulator with XRE-family HTH domain
MDVPTDVRSALNERVKELLDKHGISQQRLAERLNVKPPTVTGWMREPTGPPEIHLARLAMHVLPNVDVAERHAILADLLRLRLLAKISNDEDSAWDNELRADTIAAANLMRSSGLTNGTPKTTGRTLLDFPHAFYPLTVISGDKREDSLTRINRADFGAVSASPAEARWICKLGLRPDVEFLTDKMFVLEDVEHLKKRFAERNLLVVGSPCSNHLARYCHLTPPRDGLRDAVPIFRFNVPQVTLESIEDRLKQLGALSQKQLVGVHEDEITTDRLKHLLKYLFTGGIIDPSYDNVVRGIYMPNGLDFGLITLARNPFAKDDRFVMVMVAGFHMFGTAHAIKMLADRTKFESHPYGGVLRVSLNPGENFADRFDKSESDWDQPNYPYDKDRLLAGLRGLAEVSPGHPVLLPSTTFGRTADFVAKL